MGDIKKLDFHWKIAYEAISEDGVLTIMAPGLGMTAVLDVLVQSFLSRNSKGMQLLEKRRVLTLCFDNRRIVHGTFPANYDL